MKDFDWLYLLKSYKELVKPNFTVLEIGASNRSRTKDLSLYCKHLIGVEYYQKRLLKSNNNIQYLLGDWQKLNKIIKPNSIDLAVSSHTIEHIPDDTMALCQLYQVLKPGCFAILTTPNRKRLTRSLIEIFTKEKKFPNWEHIREYTEKDLIKLIKNSNFKIFEIKPVIFGFHFRNVRICTTKVPLVFRKYANCWEIILKK